MFAVDVGQITNGSAGQWLSGTMLGAVREYQRRTANERSARAVARGAAPWSQVPLGYRRADDKTYQPESSDNPIVQKAYEMRDNGASIAKVREVVFALVWVPRRQATCPQTSGHPADIMPAGWPAPRVPSQCARGRVASVRP